MLISTTPQSGTTGFPKASPYTLERTWLLAPQRGDRLNGKTGPNGDTWYVCMPLYHGTGGISSMACLLSGTKLAIGRKFSVRNFWLDIHESDATHFIFVGETARYLLAAPPGPYDRAHRVRVMYGNGMRPDVWARFQERFNVPEVLEFFNSTEGVFSLMNWCRGPFFTACQGHHGLILRYMLHDKYVPVAIDHETGDIYRDPSTGFATRNAYTDGGEMLVKIPHESVFQGYWNAPEATAKKYAYDVFQKGDLYYRSGDALRRDDDGKWYFMDRLGDTFRWKSENVSTAEVAAVLGRYPGVTEANVYGVLIPKHDGRAGCAALLVEDPGSFDFAGLLRHARAQLPKYAVPVFVRVVAESAKIHNNKQNKVELRAEGVDPEKVGTRTKDRILWCPPGESGYFDFGKGEWESLETGQVTL
jgi:acyl-CoA synthetase (AMP-forming)/AMP-acid ligase II